MGALALPGAAHATVTVGDVAITETNAVTKVTFTLTRDAPLLALPTSVSYATADATARTPADYTAVKGSVMFPAVPLGGTQTGTVEVTIAGDAVREPTETFRLGLSGPEVTDGEAIATITDDDPVPTAGPVPPVSPPPAATAVFGVAAPRLQRPSTVLVTTTCPLEALVCNGTLTVRTRAVRRAPIKALRKSRRLGRRDFTLLGGQTSTMRLKLKKADRVLLHRAGRLKVTALTTVGDAAGRTGRRQVNGTLVARTDHSD